MYTTDPQRAHSLPSFSIVPTLHPSDLYTLITTLHPLVPKNILLHTLHANLQCNALLTILWVPDGVGGRAVGPLGAAVVGAGRGGELFQEALPQGVLGRRVAVAPGVVRAHARHEERLVLNDHGHAIDTNV